jgi:hypothetical protein
VISARQEQKIRQSYDFWVNNNNNASVIPSRLGLFKIDENVFVFKTH